MRLFAFVVFCFAIAAACTTTRQMRAKAPKYQKLQVFGKYHPQEIVLGIRKINDGLTACSTQNGNPTGKLVIQYTVKSEDGSVNNVSTLSDAGAIKNATFASCVVKAFEGLSYDKMAAGNDTQVIYPMMFPLQK